MQCNAIYDVQRTTHNMHASVHACACCAVRVHLCVPARVCATVCATCVVCIALVRLSVYMAPVVLVEHLEKLRQNLIRDIDDVEVAP